MAGVFFTAILIPFLSNRESDSVTKALHPTFVSRFFRSPLIILFFSGYSLFAQADSLPRFELTSPARFSLAIYSLTQQPEPLFTQGMKDDTLFPPASTQKLLTASAAVLELGDSFTFNTTLSRAGRDFVIKFSGDPTLTTSDLKQLLLALKENGVTTIKGDIWLDNSIFNGYESAVGWPWDVLGVCYSAPSSAITLDENCVPGSIYTNPDGSTRVYIPEQYPILVTTQAIALDEKQQEELMCDLELNAMQSNRYQLGGCLPFRSAPLPLKFALRNTGLYGQEQITNLLRQFNIELKGTIRVGQPPPHSQQLLALKRSPLLSDLLKTMLQDSDNLIANNLTKMIGHHYFRQAGSFANGVQAIKEILSARNIDLSSAQLYDGSGLSRNNRMSGRQLLDILAFIANNDDQLHLLDTLAVAGESGTLKYKKSMRHSPVKGEIIGKSGSLYATHNMAGFGLDKSGKPDTIFVQLVTDYFPRQEDGRSELEAFEAGFYQYVTELSNEKGSE